MKKLTKVGFSALCGSLAAISSAHAGELTASGGADMTWITGSGGVTGNPIGIGSNWSLKGSTEFDNGWTMDLTIANTNLNAYSSTAIAIGMGSFGKLNINQGDSGNGIQAMDDKTPTAWEEPWGAGVGTGVRALVSGVGPYSNIQYTTPTVMGTTLVLAVAPAMGDSDTSDKTTGVGTVGEGSGYDATININPSFGTEILSGLDLYVGGHYAEMTESHSVEHDRYQAVGGVTYDLGPLSIGAQASGEYTGQDKLTTPNIHTYHNYAFGVAFNVNDDLSLSYGEMDSVKKAGNKSSVSAWPNRITVKSCQVAYTMGGASVRVADVKADNTYFGSATSDDKEDRIISLRLAF